MKEKIKEIISNILYLDSTETLDDNASLFTELGLSSIDYIDLCFELKKKFNIDVAQERLWPINNLLLEKKNYENNTWTSEGWSSVCKFLKFEADVSVMPVQKLYDHFTISYIERWLREAV